VEIRLKSEAQRKRGHDFFKNPMRVIAVSFALIIVIGALLLMLPFASRTGQMTAFPNALFTATAATCITGMFLLDINTYWNLFGQIVIITLIQLGGLGLVTITTFFNLALRKRLGFQSLHLAQESISIDTPHHVTALIRLIISATILLEALGAAVLSIVFIPQFGFWKGVYVSAFMSISAYCNAGVVVLGNGMNSLGLANYYQSPLVLVTVGLLSIIGGMGFVVWYDLFLFRKTKRLLLHTRIVVLTTVILLVGGTVGFLFSEWNNVRTIGSFTTGEKILNAAFLSTSCRTSGFYTFAPQGMTDMSRMFSMLLMFIGAAPGSTGGGIKVTTFAVLLMTTFCVMRGKQETSMMGRKIDQYTVYKALSVAILSMVACLVCTCIITFTMHNDGTVIGFGDALFETVAAYSTTGYSVGVLGIANGGSRFMLGLMMFFGRLGPVTFALSLAVRKDHKSKVIPDGKIMIG